MTGAGYAAESAASLRTRLGAALAALGLHVLALAAALLLGARPAEMDSRDPGHLTLIALERSGSAPRQQRVPVAGGPALQVAALAATPAGAEVASPKGTVPVQAEIAARHVDPVIAAPVPPPDHQREVRDTGQTAAAAYASRLWQHVAARRPHGVQLRGTVVLRFRLSPAGALIDTGIANSSGDLNLDRIALRLLRQAAPMPPPPDGLTGDQLVFTIPVEFQ